MDRYWRDWKFPGIYIIAHVPSGKRYVGQSANVARRINSHMLHSGSCLHLYRAMKLYGNEEFEAVVAERVDDIGELARREQWWIDTLDSANPDTGYNLAPVVGSTRGYKFTAEQRARLSVAHMGYKPTPESTAKRSASLKEYHKNHPKLRAECSTRQRGRKCSDESRARMSVAQNLPENLARQSAVHLGITHSDETREKISSIAKKRYENPEYLAKHTAACNTEEVNAKRSASLKEHYSDPENRAKRKAALNAPEVRANLIAACNTPEFRERSRATANARWAKVRATKQEVNGE